MAGTQYMKQTMTISHVNGRQARERGDQKAKFPRTSAEVVCVQGARDSSFHPACSGYLSPVSRR
jgi:hypothetical protein